LPLAGGGTSGVACATRLNPWGQPLSKTPTGPGTSTGTGVGASPSPCQSSGTDGTPSTTNVAYYRGNRRDNGTGDYQLGSRTYDPGKAAFLSPDTYRNADPTKDLALGTDPLTANRYNYVNGDPVNLTDPNGHRTCDTPKDCRPDKPAVFCPPYIDNYHDCGPPSVSTTTGLCISDCGVVEHAVDVYQQQCLRGLGGILRGIRGITTGGGCGGKSRREAEREILGSVFTRQVKSAESSPLTPSVISSHPEDPNNAEIADSVVDHLKTTGKASDFGHTGGLPKGELRGFVLDILNRSLTKDATVLRSNLSGGRIAIFDTAAKRLVIVNTYELDNSTTYLYTLEKFEGLR